MTAATDVASHTGAAASLRRVRAILRGALPHPAVVDAHRVDDVLPDSPG